MPGGVAIPGARLTEIVEEVIATGVARMLKTSREILPDGKLLGMTDLHGEQLIAFFAKTLTNTETGEIYWQDAMNLKDLDYIAKFVEGTAEPMISPYWRGALTDVDTFKEQQRRFLRSYASLKPLR